MSERDVVIRVEGVSKLYRLGEVGTGSLAHDVNRWWHKVRGKEDPYLKIGEVNDRTKPAKQAVASSELLVASQNTPAEGGDRAGGASELATRNQSRATAPQGGAPATSYSPLVTPKAPPSDWVYALKDVSFEVKRGEVLGIIGRNGAGKSTLLKILSRVTTQTEGRIKVKGRIASLLEVGTGFHPELTGRENIFLNGAILGMRKAEIARKFDEIVEFSGCARYIDTPVKRYSSGMYVRLAFAVAAHLEPEILIVDEVLAVGDAEFQKKCIGKMQDVAGHGRTILFVSHNMAAMQNLCNRAIYLDNGKIKHKGSVGECVEKYSGKILSKKSGVSNLGKHIKNLVCRNQNSDAQDNVLSPLFPVEFILELAADNLNCDDLEVGFAIDDNSGNRVTTITSYYSKSFFHASNGNELIRCSVNSLPLAEGEYSVKITLSKNLKAIEVIENAISIYFCQADFYGNGRLPFRNHGYFMTKSDWEIIKK